jgi:hypothetical protein
VSIFLFTSSSKPPPTAPPTKPPTNHKMKMIPVPVVGSAQRSYKKGPQQLGGHDNVGQFFMGAPGAAARRREYNFIFFERPHLRRCCRTSWYTHEKLLNTGVTA